MSGRILSSDFDGLNRIVKALGSKEVIKVGILAGKANRNAAGSRRKSGGHKVLKGTAAAQNNAEVGYLHEMGSFSRGIPARSFLIASVHHEEKRIAKIGMIGIRRALIAGNARLGLRDIGVACLAAINKAFDVGGLGKKWPALKPSTVAAKGSAAILIDTGQLRRSITFQIGMPS